MRHLVHLAAGALAGIGLTFGAVSMAQAHPPFTHTRVEGVCVGTTQFSPYIDRGPIVFTSSVYTPSSSGACHKGDQFVAVGP